MKINVFSALGSPISPRTWSGTPNNIIKELSKIDALGDCNVKFYENIESHTFFKIAYKYNSKFLWGGRLGRTLRYLMAWHAERMTRKAGSNITLHFGTHSLPFRKYPADQNHYLFIDSTWRLWSIQGAELVGFAPKLVQDTDKLETLAFKQARHIFPTSQFVKDDLINHYHINESKITVVGTGTGIIKPYFEKKDYANGKILFVAKGRFEDKGGPLVLKAFMKALETNPNLHLSIVGQKFYGDIVSHPNISTYGFLPIEELQELFNSHSLFLMPSTYEPWGLVYVEALLCKMPIMGLNKNSFPELSQYGKFGKSIDMADPGLLAESINNMFANTALMKEMGESGQQFALNNFTWEKSVEKIVRVIKSQVL